METVKQEATEERTFTQSELDAIVADRLKRDRQKYADYEQLKDKAAEYDRLSEASKSELQKAVEARDALQKELDDLKSAAAIREIRAKVSEETGIPMSLITAATEEDCKAQAQAILSFTQAQGYPAVKDAGEVVTGGKQTTKQQFAQWANEAFN